MSGAASPEVSVYEAMGGRATFERLVRRFYAGVRDDELLAPMYPEDDLEGAIERLTMFLEQYWGGPRTYSDTRGHPRLRMRHVPYAVTPAARDRWLAHMRDGLDELDLSAEHEDVLWDYLVKAAYSLVNTLEQP